MSSPYQNGPRPGRSSAPERRLLHEEAQHPKGVRLDGLAFSLYRSQPRFAQTGFGGVGHALRGHVSGGCSGMLLAWSGRCMGLRRRVVRSVRAG
ncbi:MAG: hypothetical protein ABF535_01390 [Acetobacter sp.]